MQRILLLNVSTIKEKLQEISDFLKLDQNTVNSRKDKDLYIATRLIENYILNGREKHVTSDGKPYAIEGSRYNLSQKGDYACAIESDDEVGIDIEKETVFTAHFKERLFSDKDKLPLDSDLDILRGWTIKEACVKCLGVGLKGIFDVNILNNNQCLLNNETYFFKSFFFDSYCISVVSRNEIEADDVIELTLDDLFINK